MGCAITPATLHQTPFEISQRELEICAVLIKLSVPHWFAYTLLLPLPLSLIWNATRRVSISVAPVKQFMICSLNLWALKTFFFVARSVGRSVARFLLFRHSAEIETVNAKRGSSSPTMVEKCHSEHVCGRRIAVNKHILRKYNDIRKSTVELCSGSQSVIN